MFLMLPSTKIEQMVFSAKEKRRKELEIRNNLRRSLLHQWSKLKIISHKSSYSSPLPGLLRPLRLDHGAIKKRNIFKWYLFSHWPKHHPMCQDSGERSRVIGPSCSVVSGCVFLSWTSTKQWINFAFTKSRGSFLCWIRACLILGLPAPVYAKCEGTAAHRHHNRIMCFS